MTTPETLYTIALTLLTRIKTSDRNHLLSEAGSATAIFEHRRDITKLVPTATPALQAQIKDMELYLPQAEKEVAFVEKNGIRVLIRGAADYPQRLMPYSDAPTVLFCYGNGCDLNARHIVSIVGTRQITTYGKELCAEFVRDLSATCPNTLVVSGLAYGVDIHAHRAALENQLPTVGVVAHGLDQIYPRMHRDTALQMIHQGGGLLTEYPSGTAIDRRLFVERNRIVAGMADAVVVVESADKGGSLITAELAGGYDKEVFAFPGRTVDVYSAGCNSLIASQRAQMLLDAKQFAYLMGWENEAEQQRLLAQGVQQELFQTLTPQEQQVVDALKGSEGIAINALALQTGLPVSQLSSILFALEMNGVVKKMGGNRYRL